MGNVAKLPVLNVLLGTHFVADVTLGIGEVVHDYLTRRREAPVQNLSLAAEPAQSMKCVRRAKRARTIFWDE
ncbi:MAG: hypothetical protein ACREQT_16565 [Candidatus Binataceae bacterium]